MGSKHQFKVKLPTGERVWASGNTIDEMFASFVQKYGVLYQQTPILEEKPKCQTLREFVDNLPSILYVRVETNDAEQLRKLSGAIHSPVFWRDADGRSERRYNSSLL